MTSTPKTASSPTTPTTRFGDDVLLLEWQAESEKVKADDGIDTFVFRDGLIRVPTVRYTLTSTQSSRRAGPRPGAAARSYERRST